MKRFSALLLAALLLLSLAACGKKQAPPAEPVTPEPAAPSVQPVPAAEPPDAAPEALHFDALNVEFVSAGHSTDALLRLRSELPDALRASLAEQLLEVDTIGLTFSPGADATVAALTAGSVQAAFLPAETYLTDETLFYPLALQSGAADDLSRSVLVVRAGANRENAKRVAAAFDGLAALETYGSFTSDLSGLDALRRAMTEDDPSLVRDLGDDSVLLTLTAHVSGYYEPLRLDVIGRSSGESGAELWGVDRIEVYDANYLIQTIPLKEAINADGLDGIALGYTECPSPELTAAVGDFNFDGSDDIAVYGWVTMVNAPYYYYLWDPETLAYEYGFCLAEAEFDAESKQVVSTTRSGASEYQTDTYAYVDGALTLIDSVRFGPEIDAREAVEAYYAETVFTVDELLLDEAGEDSYTFLAYVSKGGEKQEVPRGITVELVDGVWTVTGEGY